MIIDNLIIIDFENAWFKDDRTILSQEQFEQAYSEYMDISGLYKTKNFQELAYINFLSIRVSSLNISIQSQRDFIEQFGEPYIEGFDFFKRYGHKLYWDGNKEDFLNALKKVENKEKKHSVDLHNKQKIWIENQTKKVHEQKSIMQTRHEWIRNITILKKNGYQIDRNKDYVEELAIIMKENLEEQNQSK